jgi:hypothetical protein
MTALTESMTEKPRENMKASNFTSNVANMGQNNQPKHSDPGNPRSHVPRMTFSALLWSAREAKQSEDKAWMVLGLLGALVLALSFWP